MPSYLIWEGNGKLSKNIARRTDQVIANGEEGSSTQVLVDLVVAGGKNTVYEDSPLLLVWVTDPLDSSRPAFVDKGWSISYVGLTGETVRSIIVDHDCNPVTLHARIDAGDVIGREVTKELNITCGD